MRRGGGRPAQTQKQKSTIINILIINETGFELKSPDVKLSTLNKKQTDYDWDGLKQHLATVKTKYPESEDIIISPVSSIKYHTIISVMDRCRESGFPNISISG